MPIIRKPIGSPTLRLADLELEARNARSIECRFRLSRLQAHHSIDSFNFKHHKSRTELKNRILRLLDLDFLQKGTSAIFIGNPGMGKTFLAKIAGGRSAGRISVCFSPPLWTCSITLFRNWRRSKPPKVAPI